MQIITGLSLQKATKKTDRPRLEDKDDLDVTELTNEDLLDQLVKYGVNPGPIVGKLVKFPFLWVPYIVFLSCLAVRVWVLRTVCHYLCGQDTSSLTINEENKMRKMNLDNLQDYLCCWNCFIWCSCHKYLVRHRDLTWQLRKIWGDLVGQVHPNQ